MAELIVYPHWDWTQKMKFLIHKKLFMFEYKIIILLRDTLVRYERKCSNNQLKDSYYVLQNH
jgi:hypothetical protein